MRIEKRNGIKVEFERKKITNAILKAMKYGSGIFEPEIAEKISEEIEYECMNNANNQISKGITNIEKVENQVMILDQMQKHHQDHL